MTESTVSYDGGKRGRVTSEVHDLTRGLSSEFSAPPTPQHSCVEEREHLQVYLRIRPFTSAESGNGESQDCVTIESPDTVLLRPPSSSLSARLSAEKALPQTGQRFQFSEVYGPETTQRQLFRGTVKDLVKDVLEGGNSLVFTYGVTNAGKTFTFLGPDADAGILPRSLDVIFSSIDERVFTETSLKPHRCREFTRLSGEQQAEEGLFKRNLFRQLKECERSNASLLSSTDSSLLGSAAAPDDRISLQVDQHTKFSVWVSFCEIYNENIHDLLEAVPGGALRRAALRLSQDVKGNAFVKDLRWVQVNSAEEAYMVMKLGKKNQSFSSTRLNQLSSRSHSIFSIRILRIEDTGNPRVHAVSELSLCDLAGSERCAKTQNKGERLKEAGNINTSLLILGKCINALRHNQQAKLLQHIPFRESKLTHYLQGFFSGRGKACMIVNINQCASMYDETLNVLKFSAVAQKVVVLFARPPPATGDASLIISTAERKSRRSGRRSSLIGWDSSLEDVQEDECEEEPSLMDDSMDQTGAEDDEMIEISKRTQQRQAALLKQLQVQLKKERAEGLLMEGRVREEISREFSDLFSEMQHDYNERLVREREILEERAERRLEIFKNLIDKMAPAGRGADAQTPDDSLLSGCSELAAAPHQCLCSGRAGGAAVEELKRRVLELSEQLDHKHSGEASEVEREKKAGLPARLSAEESQLQEALAALEKEKRGREEALAALEFQTVGKEEALASLEEERKAREEVAAALRELQRSREEVLASQEAESREEAQARLEEQRKEISRLAEEGEDLHRQVGELTAKLQDAEQQVSSETRRAEQTTNQLRTAEAQLDEHAKSLQEQTSEIQTLRSEVQQLKRELQAAAASGDEEVSALRKETESKQGRILELQRQLAQAAETLSQKQLIWDQQLEQLHQREASSERLREQEEKLREEEEASRRQLEELRRQLSQQEETSAERLDVLKLKLSEQEPTAEDLKKLNADLQAEVTSLRAKVEEVTDTQRQAEEKLAQLQEASAGREAELREKEAQAKSLQKSLEAAQERREEEESQAVQEARQREAERRRELLAVAHEAIAQKDGELERKAEEISRLKESAKQDSDKVKSLNLDLQRKDDDASDLREKLADYKKQVQQIQKEISVMREEERALKQKLSDGEKSRKQLQSDVAGRDRLIQQLRSEQSSDAKSEETLQLYQKARKDLEAKERVMEDMRLALTEQEETQNQMEQVLEEKLRLAQELAAEVEMLKATLLQQEHGNGAQRRLDNPSDQLKEARQEAAQAQESLKLCAEKHQTERKKWLEEKLSLIGQAKEAEDKRNQEMRKFMEDRERYTRQQSQLDSVSSQLVEKEATMEKWRKERDTLVAALEVQLQKLLCSQAEKDKLIQELQRNGAPPPQERADGDGAVAELQAALSEKEAEILRLKEELEASAAGRDDGVTQTEDRRSPATLVGKPQSEAADRKSGGRLDARASVSSQGSASYPSVLDSSEISTENGRTSRFPRPELEISFSPLQPNRMALRRQGDENAITVKIPRPSRKRKSGEMDKDEVEAHNRRNTRTKLTPKLTPHQEEVSTAMRHDSQSSIRSRKEGTLQKIGDFLQSSPTLLGTKAKKMMSLVSGRGDADSPSSSSSSSSLSLRAKKKKNLYRPEISSPMDMPSHPIISRDPEEKDGEQIIKRRLRSRIVK